MPDNTARAGQLEIIEADIEAEEIGPTPQGCLNEIIQLFPTLSRAAQEAVYLAVLAYAALACVA